MNEKQFGTHDETAEAQEGEKFVIAIFKSDEEFFFSLVGSDRTI